MPTAANTAVTLLGMPGSLKWQRRGADVVIQTPSVPLDQLPGQYAYAFKVTGVPLQSAR